MDHGLDMPNVVLDVATTVWMDGLQIRLCRFSSTDAMQHYLLFLHPLW